MKHLFLIPARVSLKGFPGANLVLLAGISSWIPWARHWARAVIEGMTACE